MFSVSGFRLQAKGLGFVEVLRFRAFRVLFFGFRRVSGCQG